MKRSRPTGKAESAIGVGNIPTPVQAAFPGSTGRYLILMEPDDLKGAVKSLQSQGGIKLQSVAGLEVAAATEASVKEGEGITFHDLGVAVVNAPPDQLSAISSAVASAPNLHMMEPERFVFALGALDVSYMRGYRDAVNHLYDQIAGGNERLASLGLPSPDESSLSWGIQATNVANSRYSGRGIKVAILDTGIDQTHPDFAGRRIEARSFVDGLPVQDGHGHGTHCAGLACGPLRPQRTPRFGVAYESDLYIGKVLNDAGQGVDANIIAGIQWALASGCDIVSMSLGGPVPPGTAYSPLFEQVAQRALARGTIIVAAAGNDSNRPRGVVAQVSHPANCPSMMAVAAVDHDLNTAWFSNAGSAANGSGGKIDIAGPGVDVISDWPTPTMYKSESGTSMATPYVAGIAALLAQSNPAARGRQLMSHLIQGAKPLSAGSLDVGSGLVQAL